MACDRSAVFRDRLMRFALIGEYLLAMTSLVRDQGSGELYISPGKP